MHFLVIFLSVLFLGSAVIAQGDYVISSSSIEQLVQENFRTKGSVKCYYEYLEAELEKIFQKAKKYCLKNNLYPETNDEPEKFIRWMSDLNPSNYNERLSNFQNLMKNNSLYVKEWVIIRHREQDIFEELCNSLTLAILDLLDAEGKNNILFSSEQGKALLPNFDILATVTQRKVIVQILPVSFFKTVFIRNNQGGHDINKLFIKNPKKIIVKKYNSASLRKSDELFSSRDRYFIVVMSMGLVIVLMGSLYERFNFV